MIRILILWTIIITCNLKKGNFLFLKLKKESFRFKKESFKIKSKNGNGTIFKGMSHLPGN